MLSLRRYFIGDWSNGTLGAQELSRRSWDFMRCHFAGFEGTVDLVEESGLYHVKIVQVFPFTGVLCY